MKHNRDYTPHFTSITTIFLFFHQITKRVAKWSNIFIVSREADGHRLKSGQKVVSGLFSQNFLIGGPHITNRCGKPQNEGGFSYFFKILSQISLRSGFSLPE